VGAREHKPSDSVGVTKREFLGNHPPKRHAEHVSALNTQRVKQRRGVVGHVGDGERLLRLVSTADAAVVE
jgi:hypothetical protein